MGEVQYQRPTLPAKTEPDGWQVVQDQHRHTIGFRTLPNGRRMRKDVLYPHPADPKGEIDERITVHFQIQDYDLRTQPVPEGVMDSFVGSDGKDVYGYCYSIPLPGSPDTTPCWLNFGDHEEQAEAFTRSLVARPRE